MVINLLNTFKTCFDVRMYVFEFLKGSALIHAFLVEKLMCGGISRSRSVRT